ncbi:MAG TPA: DUF3307 domain-containing protein [Candidatus Acidoferrum sp.]|nr:DUF3307 domain-containing protein [Candidatus Acidoferrum sp.]
MQMLFRTFLAVCFAHLLTDFVLQTHRLVERKRRGRPTAYLLHGLIHYLSAILIAGFFVSGSLTSSRTHLVIAGLTLVHLLIDLAKIQLAAKRWISDGSRAYLLDQLLHFLTIGFAAWLLSPAVRWNELSSAVQQYRMLPNKFLAVPVVYIGVIFGGGYLIRFLTRVLAEGVKTHSPEKSGEQLQNTGLYIGWLERFLVLTALLLQSPATVGLIMTSKAIARYPEFKSERFAEYFLIGTLLSISIALVGGAFLAKLLLGQARFS